MFFMYYEIYQYLIVKRMIRLCMLHLTKDTVRKRILKVQMGKRECYKLSQLFTNLQ